MYKCINICACFVSLPTPDLSVAGNAPNYYYYYVQIIYFVLYSTPSSTLPLPLAPRHWRHGNILAVPVHMDPCAHVKSLYAKFSENFSARNTLIFHCFTFISKNKIPTCTALLLTSGAVAEIRQPKSTPWRPSSLLLSGVFFVSALSRHECLGTPTLT